VWLAWEHHAAKMDTQNSHAMVLWFSGRVLASVAALNSITVKWATPKVYTVCSNLCIEAKKNYGQILAADSD